MPIRPVESDMLLIVGPDGRIVGGLEVDAPEAVRRVAKDAMGHAAGLETHMASGRWMTSAPVDPWRTTLRAGGLTPALVSSLSAEVRAGVDAAISAPHVLHPLAADVAAKLFASFNVRDPFVAAADGTSHQLSSWSAPWFAR